MRSVVLLLFISVFATLNSFAQPLNNFSGSIIKVDDSAPSTELSLADFKMEASSGFGARVLEAERTNPGVAFLSSAILPGSAQAANGKWVRAGIYALTEAATVFFHFNRKAVAKRQEREYEQYANTNWSVVAYAQWLVSYSQEYNLENNYQQLASNIAGKSPDFNNSTNDWFKVDISTLRQVERETPYVFENKRTSNFSHNLPDYGSQQYYELISKYWQFQSGWQDAHEKTWTSPNFPFYKWDGSDASPQFYLGRDRAAEFNDNYRLAGNILNLIVINHIISAFDGLMTVKLKNSRLHAQANLLRLDSFSLVLDF
ncbi:MAG: hypothetical protein WC967_05250 [Balneolaceae bacterium]